MYSKNEIITTPSRPGIRRSITNSRDATDLTFGIPSVLEQYLITTTLPHEIYSTLHESREHRLRLLLRRFTNQIQYGCKNPHCDTPTCFSFRKRNSPVPIRPYNDLAARALAWRCVEEYASSGKPICPKEELQKKGKRKPVNGERKDGLCWNEPMVPWYQVPADHAVSARENKSRKTALDSKQRRSSSRSPQISGAVPTQENPIANVDTGSGQPGQSRSEIEVNEARRNANAKAEDQTPRVNRTNSEPTGKSLLTVKNVDLPRERSVPKKDTASFPQRFYDTQSLKNIEDPVSEINDASALGISEVSQNARINEDSQTGSNTSIAHLNTTNLSRPVSTFKLLPTSALVWLRHATSRQPNRKELEPNSNSDIDCRTDLDQFARQCLYFCLSNPFRLLKSAQMWRFDKEHRNIKKEASDSKALVMLQETVTQIASNEKTSMTASEIRLPPMQNILQAFALFSKIQPYPEILNHMFASLQYAYVLPPALKRSNLSSRRTSVSVLEGDISSKNTKSDDTDLFLDDDKTANLCMLILMALFRAVEKLSSNPLSISEKSLIYSKMDYLICRDLGTVFPHSHMFHTFPKSTDRQWRAKYRGVISLIDAHDDPCYLRLLEGFADVISHRLALTETLRAKGTSSHKSSIVDRIVKLLLELKEPFDDPGICHSAWLLLELMCLLLLKKWDRNPIVQRTGPISGALQIMAALYRSRTKLGMPAFNFSFTFIAEAFDPIKTPIEWLSFREDSKHIHILSFSFLFRSATLVKYFRAINIEIMKRAHHYALLNQYDVRRFLNQPSIPLYGATEMLASLRPHMALYFVLTAKRSNLLEDAIDQIWRRQRQELMRPLKVVLGKGEGEDGLDHGGVQQEFFRLIFAEALNPDYGMFTIDGRTRMTWFQPGSMEPLYKFEAIGILMSLAVYNGVTLPITFPLAFYRRLLNLKVKQLDQIEDGWPELTKGLTILRDWEDGDVGDVIARTYEFSYEIFGSNVDIDMTKVGRDDHWPPAERRKSKDRVKTATFEMFHHDIPTPPSESDRLNGKFSPRPFRSLRSPSHDLLRSPTPLSILCSNTGLLTSIPNSPTSSMPPEEAPLVTNSNRNRYIKDYIFWLTDKSIAPQYDAFAKGFYTCLDPTALSIFTPEALKSVVEGYTEIDIEGLQAAATYEEYTEKDDIIIDFWSVVKDFSPEQHKRLLEFVTASERIPVNGIKSVMFLIQRNGVGDERLPSSATCYGRLLLPHYSSKEVLREKLAKAIENSVGFGSL